MPYFYGFDYTYLVIVLPCLIFAMLASSNVNSTFKRYSQQLSSRRITGAEAAQRVLSGNGVTGVRIERIPGKLSDHYDPRSNVIRLSEDVYSSTSVAAIGVACHEAGHAVQYAVGYSPIKLRAAIIPVTNFGSKLAMPLILMGLLFSFLGNLSVYLVYAGIVCFSLSVVFQFITLPVEFNASSRAMKAIAASGMLTAEEQQGARKTLSAAAMTYVAATAVALAQLLRLLVIFGRRSNNRD